MPGRKQEVYDLLNIGEVGLFWVKRPARIAVAGYTDPVSALANCGLIRAAVALALAVLSQQVCVAQAKAPTGSGSYRKVCTIYFDKDPRRPARVEDEALSCLLQARQLLSANPGTGLYLVATADRNKDNQAGHGRARTEQDMSGEDLRYADVAAYRAVNAKAYMVQWLSMNPKRIVPLTTYEDGQWLEIYLVPKAVTFKTAYDKPTAPILSRPCTVAPCAVGYEEFLVAQPRGRIAK